MEMKVEIAPELRDLNWDKIVHVSLSSDILRALSCGLNVSRLHTDVNLVNRWNLAADVDLAAHDFLSTPAVVWTVARLGRILG